jgi:hypothetical protein
MTSMDTIVSIPCCDAKTALFAPFIRANCYRHMY